MPFHQAFGICLNKNFNIIVLPYIEISRHFCRIICLKFPFYVSYCLCKKLYYVFFHIECIFKGESRHQNHTASFRYFKLRNKIVYFIIIKARGQSYRKNLVLTKTKLVSNYFMIIYLNLAHKKKSITNEIKTNRKMSFLRHIYFIGEDPGLNRIRKYP